MKHFHTPVFGVCVAGLAVFGQAETKQADGLEWGVPLVQEVMREQRIPGVVIGILQGKRMHSTRALGWRDVAAELPMTRDTLFQVGSITKPMTATLLALLVERRVVGLQDTLGQHLPPDLALPEDIAAITLEQLATHTSGLPREPVNRRNVPGSPSVMEPYSIEELYAGLALTRLEAPSSSRWDYSNLGYALLGHVLERASGLDYRTLLRVELLEPLSMEASGVTPTEDHERRLALHYWPEDEAHVARERWKMGEVVGAMGAYSCVDDLGALLAAQWTAEGAWPRLRPLLQEPRVETGIAASPRMTLAWFLQDIPGVGPLLGYGGEVDGHSACIAVLPRSRAGLVVLCNYGGSSAEAVLRALMPGFLERQMAATPARDATDRLDRSPLESQGRGNG